MKILLIVGIFLLIVVGSIKHIKSKPMIHYKRGVKVSHLNPKLITAIQSLDSVRMSVFGKSLVITSGNDGEHMKSSKHYTDDAVDVRTRDLNTQEKDLFTKIAQTMLGNQFQVILEKDHLHIEYDPS